jgi:hypothetical protein
LKLLKKNPVDDSTRKHDLALETLEYKGFPRNCGAALLWSRDSATKSVVVSRRKGRIYSPVIERTNDP